jgi:hypothetical protein
MESLRFIASLLQAAQWDGEPVMVSDLKARNSHSNMEQAIIVRQQTSELLNRLVTDRDQIERRIAETGRRDPLKSVTGRTALDNAINSAREMIHRMDLLLAEMNQELGLPSSTDAGSGRPQRNSASKAARRQLIKSFERAVPVAVSP